MNSLFTSKYFFLGCPTHFKKTKSVNNFNIHGSILMWLSYYVLYYFYIKVILIIQSFNRFFKNNTYNQKTNGFAIFSPITFL